MALANKDKDFAELFAEISKTLCVKGMRETINHLKKSREQELVDEKVKYIIDAVIDSFDNKNCLLSKRDDVNVNARALLSYILKMQSVSISKIAFVLKVSRPSVYNMIEYFKSANLVNPKVPSDIMLKSAYEKVNEKLNNKK